MAITQAIANNFKKLLLEGDSNFKQTGGDKYKLAFANGGDQDNTICPEADICNSLGIKLIDGLGKKIQSSSWLLKK